jgi:RNA polymerase sigma factor (sigma-70 family)
VQDTLLRALQRAESFHGDASLATCLHRILHNLAIDRFRRDREDACEDVEREVEQRWRDDSYTVDATTVVERAETRQELEDALVRLPVIYRTMVVLHDAEEMTVAQIADIQGVGLPAAKQRLRRGRMMLVDALAQGRARRDALSGVPLRCWDAGARSRTTSTMDYRPPIGCSWSVTSKPVRRARRCMPRWWGRGLPWAPYVTPTTSFRLRWPTGSRSYSSTSDPGGCRLLVEFSTALWMFSTPLRPSAKRLMAHCEMPTDPDGHCPGAGTWAPPASTRSMSTRWCLRPKSGYLLVCSRLSYESHRCVCSPEEPRTGSRPWPSALQLAGSNGFA